MLMIRMSYQYPVAPDASSAVVDPSDTTTDEVVIPPNFINIISMKTANHKKNKVLQNL